MVLEESYPKAREGGLFRMLDTHHVFVIDGTEMRPGVEIPYRGYILYSSRNNPAADYVKKPDGNLITGNGFEASGIRPGDLPRGVIWENRLPTRR